MSKFIKKTVLFILPIILLAYPIDVFISSQLKKSSTFALNEYKTWNELYANEINAEVLIYGGSRAKVHVNPKIIEEQLGMNTYNLGIDGHNFLMQNYRHSVMLKTQKKPKYIIISLDVFTLRKREGFFNLKQLLPYMLFNDDLFTHVKDYSNISKYDFNIPLIRYFGNNNALNEAMVMSFTSGGKKIGYKGFKPVDRKWDEKGYKAKISKPSFIIEQDIYLINKFNHFLDNCKKNNINVVLVYSPVYIGGQNIVKNKDDIISFYENIAELNEIPFFNYLDNEISFDKDNFYNVLHLNSIGSEKFTYNLAKDLLKEINYDSRNKCLFIEL